MRIIFRTWIEDTPISYCFNKHNNNSTILPTTSPSTTNIHHHNIIPMISNT